MASNDSAFEKDFGYLLPFLDRVAAAIARLPDQAAREEGNRLIVGEREKWERLRQLLAGSEGRQAAASASAATSSAGATAANPAAPRPSPAMEVPVPAGLTVGSLKVR